MFGAWRARFGLCVASQHSTVPVLKIRRETTTRTFANRWKERVHDVHAVHEGCPSMVARDYAAAWLVPDMPLSRVAARAHAIKKNTDYHESTLREPRCPANLNISERLIWALWGLSRSTDRVTG